MKRTLLSFCILTAAVGMLTGCAKAAPAEQTQAPVTTAEPVTTAAPETTAPETTTEETTEATTEPIAPARLTYLGHASMRIETAEGKIIYVDPYAGADSDYALPADLILITHGHGDHTAVDKIAVKNEGCRTITWEDALAGGGHESFDLGYVLVESTEAGNNQFHSLTNAVGYILTFSNGITLYLTGDTSATEQMAQLARRQLDYAFFCCDGVYNMDITQAKNCAEIVGARHSSPYHMVPGAKGLYDQTAAEQFDVPGALLVSAGSDLVLE